MATSDKNKKSGNPAKRAAAKKASSAASWKAAAKPAPLDLPSGNTALIKTPGLTALLAEGILSDTLTPLAEAAVQKGKGKGAKQASDEDLKKMAQDPEKMQAALESIDKVAAHCIVEPKVRYYKYKAGDLEVADDSELLEKVIPEEDRDEEIVYTDEIDLDDKMFIFNVVCGGTRDLEEFRREHNSTVAGVLAVDVSEGETE